MLCIFGHLSCSNLCYNFDSNRRAIDVRRGIGRVDSERLRSCDKGKEAKKPFTFSHIVL